MKREDLEGAIEAILLVTSEPVTVDNLVRTLGGQANPAEIAGILKDIERRYDETSLGISLRQTAGGYQFVTRAEHAVFVKNFLKEHNLRRLSQAAVETLAIIAYKQPLTAAEVSTIRNTESQQVIKGLLEKKLVKISGRKAVIGRPLLYSTTKEFLMHFSLNSLADLPSFEELEDVFDENIKQETLFRDVRDDEQPATEPPATGEVEASPEEPAVHAASEDAGELVGAGETDPQNVQ
ncbi:MAG TPA: SMC-Scp complex subunit ScpB [Acidobacteriota bacterium]|jgi:segregation and condensation protein B|nr:SMC-Scp complex subunit ScpB [Acidobacteriota bacterium]HQO20358.1 SMC-Scp complex subunit ScpB [Acidobacteriota bacterium]HQQ47008.1 SMC-Scp complex subunit ScpB [Acidobacteriota bacterium]